MHHIKPQVLKTNGKPRRGRAFSRRELTKAGLNLQEARLIELPVDFRRQTAHDGNVEAIKAYASHMKTHRKLVAKPTAKTAAKAEKRKA